MIGSLAAKFRGTDTAADVYLDMDYDSNASHGSYHRWSSKLKLLDCLLNTNAPMKYYLSVPPDIPELTTNHRPSSPKTLNKFRMMEAVNLHTSPNQQLSPQVQFPQSVTAFHAMPNNSFPELRKRPVVLERVRVTSNLRGRDS